MINEITDKNFIILIRGGYKIYITEIQMNAIKDSLEKGKGFIYLDKGLFNASDIVFILSAGEVEKDDRVKRGEWKCEYGEWHERGQQCGHRPY